MRSQKDGRREKRGGGKQDRSAHQGKYKYTDKDLNPLMAYHINVRRTHMLKMINVTVGNGQNKYHAILYLCLTLIPTYETAPHIQSVFIISFIRANSGIFFKCMLKYGSREVFVIRRYSSLSFIDTMIIH